jgi:hypothetical protein
MKKVFLLWRCDVNISRDSYRLIYVGESFVEDISFGRTMMLERIIDEAKRYSLGSIDGEMDYLDLLQLRDLKQTQDRQENYVIEMLEVGKILEKVIN